MRVADSKNISSSSILSNYEWHCQFSDEMYYENKTTVQDYEATNYEVSHRESKKQNKKVNKNDRTTVPESITIMVKSPIHLKNEPDLNSCFII